MLVGFAAVIAITSVATGLTGAFVAPADAAPAGSSSYYSVVADAPSGSGTAAVAPGSLLGSIAGLSGSAVPGFISAHRADLDRMLVTPPRAGDVSAVWRLLDPVKQAALVDEAPHVIGNLEGVPYAVRGTANALDLKRTIASTTERLTTEKGKAVRLELERRLTTLDNVKKALTVTDGVKRTLVNLDTSDDARASIVVGDLSTARYVSVLVPGMYMSVGEQIVDWAKVAQNLHDQETSFLHRLLGPRSSGGTPGVAVVAWIGYQTPVLTNIGGTQLAMEGADSLERTLVGIQELRKENPPYLSVFAHSYGSTAALLALERKTVTVDALALMGSPGSDAQSVAELSVRDGNVFVGQADLDPVVHSAFFGSDPGSPSYGAQRMDVGGAVDPITGRTLSGSSGHNEYFSASTECMRNLAMIGIDQGDLVISSTGSSGAVVTAAER